MFEKPHFFYVPNTLHNFFLFQITVLVCTVMWGMGGGEVYIAYSVEVYFKTE